MEVSTKPGAIQFLLSNADEIEVIEPPVIRAHVRDALRRAVSLYADD